MIKENCERVTFLMAEDDEDDRMLAGEALRSSGLLNEVIFVEDGEQLIDYLYGNGKYSDRSVYPFPGLILLDLNMPKMDGRQVLEELNRSEMIKKLPPIIVLTTSSADEDLMKSYNLGVSSFITKPVSLDKLAEVMQCISNYWIRLVSLPKFEEEEIVRSQ